jgi:hypothetical protein
MKYMKEGFNSASSQSRPLCLLLEALMEEPVFTEAAIYLIMFRCYRRE